MRYVTTKYLKKVLDSYQMSHVEIWRDRHITKRNEVRDLLIKNYQDRIYSPFDSGSYLKKTEINLKFDIDLVVPFRKSKVDTLKYMYHELGSLLKKLYPDISLRHQKVSFGLTFIENQLIYNKEIKIDIIPGCEINPGQYRLDKNLNLYVNDYEKDSILTNIHSQLAHIRGQEYEKNIIKLIKILKCIKNIPIKSFAIELLIIKAFNDQQMPISLWEQARVVLLYIYRNIETIQLIDPGNPHNIVSDLLTSHEKAQIKQAALEAWHALDDPSQIADYFPINKQFA